MRKPKWYAIQVQVGREDRLRKDITKKVRIESMERLIRQVVLKRHPEAVLRKQKIETHQKKSFPGYLLLEMIANHDTISFVKEFKGVIGFLPSNEHPRKKRSRYG
jgi:transcription termination/antitermination protein NusG